MHTIGAKWMHTTVSVCAQKFVFSPGTLKAGIITSQFSGSQERLDICFVCLFYLTAHQCHLQNKLESMQSVPSVNND